MLHSEVRMTSVTDANVLYHLNALMQVLEPIISFHKGHSKRLPDGARLSSSTCRGLSCLLWVDLLSVLVVSDTWWGSAVAAAFTGANTNDLSVDGAGDAVLELQVHLGDGVFWIDRGLGDITDSGRLDHVPYGESLDCLVLWSASRAVGATDRVDVTTTLLVASATAGIISQYSYE
jgi:hypothetical protein